MEGRIKGISDHSIVGANKKKKKVNVGHITETFKVIELIVYHL